jgi:hypothetical protein
MEEDYIMNVSLFSRNHFTLIWGMNLSVSLYCFSRSNNFLLLTCYSSFARIDFISAVKLHV